jgi:hypothetical protein
MEARQLVKYLLNELTLTWRKSNISKFTKKQKARSSVENITEIGKKKKSICS